MCRHLAYLGPPIRLGEVLSDPPFALVRQAWAPRRQSHGTMNADGFGLGWYTGGGQAGGGGGVGGDVLDPVPARHRGAGPIWDDDTFADLARTVRAGAFLAAVRSATAGMALGQAAAAPFRSGPWLFSHNGALADWPRSGARLLRDLDAETALRIEAPVDSALLWAMTVNRLERGATPAEALADVVKQASSTADGDSRLNLLLTDGRTICATTWGDVLSWRRLDGGGVLVASEPYDDDPGWHDIPDQHVITAAIDDDREIRVNLDAL